MLFGLCSGVRNEVELPKCHERILIHVSMCVIPLPVHTCRSHSWSGCSFTGPCYMQSRFAQKCSTLSLNHTGLGMPPSP